MMKSKANDGSGNILERDTWETPQELFNILNEQYVFTLDCCANEENNKCKWFTSDFLNLKIECIKDNCWMNPPFSKAYEMFNHFFKVVSKGVCIYRCDNMETRVWQDVILKHATWILIPKGRISYEGMKGTGSRFPSALIGFNVKPPKYVKGVVLRR